MDDPEERPERSSDTPGTGRRAGESVRTRLRARLAGALDEVRGRTSRAGVAALTAVIGAALLRFYRLGSESLWLDEAFTWSYVTQIYQFWELLFVLPTEDVHPPLYYVVVDLWVALAGTSEAALRLPSVVFGIAAVGLIYLLGARLFDRWTGAAAAALLSVSSFHVYFSQEARMYSLLAALTLASFYFFVDIAGDRAHSRTAVLGYLVASTLLVYTHVYGLFVIVAQQAYLFPLLVLSHRDWPFVGRYSKPSVSLREWVATGATLLVLSAPWLLVLFNRVSHFAQGQCSSLVWIPEPCLGSVANIVTRYCFYCGNPQLFPHALGGDPTGGLIFPAVLAGVVGLAGLGVVGRKNSAVGRPDRRQWMVLLWLLVPVVVPFVLSYAFAPILMPRYTIAASLAMFLLVAKGLRTLPVSLGVLLAGIVLIGLLAPLAPYYADTQKQQWDAVAPAVESEADEQALVLVSQSHFVTPYQYYAGRDAENVAGIDDDATRSTVKGAVSDYESVWLVLSRARYDPMAEHLQSLGYVSVRADTSRQICIYHFTRDANAAKLAEPPPAAACSNVTEVTSREDSRTGY